MTVPVRPQVPGEGRLGFCAVALAAARYRPVRWRTYVRMRRTYVYKLEPTAVQDQALNRYLNVTRNLYNAALEQRNTVYRGRGETRINIGQRAWAVPFAEAASGSCASMSSRR